MSMEVQGEVDEDAATVQEPDATTGQSEGTPSAEREVSDEVSDGRNGVAVHFDDGTVGHYAFVLRQKGADWLHAERLVGDGDGLDDEEIEAINADAVRRIRSADVHVVGDCAVHCGAGLVVDPETLLAECGFGP